MRMYLVCKRAFDFTAAACGLILACPLMAVLAVAVKLTSPGPVLYRGERIGRNGRVFRQLKFRTMIASAEQLGGSATANDDARLTSFGRRIRKYKLDELPQLWNILVGDMSLVGPRPEVEAYVAAFCAEERIILGVRPGLTDWATIWNSDEGAALAGSTNPEQMYKEVIRPIKTELQLLYCRHKCFSVDLRILWHTVLKLINREWVPEEIRSYGSSLKMGSSCDRVRNDLCATSRK